MPAAPEPGLPDLPRTFRPYRTRIVLIGIGAVMFAVISVVALLLDSVRPWERASFIIVAALVLAVLSVLSRPKVVAEATGVTVVNLVRSRRLAWAEILGVNLRHGDPWVLLDLSDGTTLPVLGIQLGIGREQAIRDANALRALAEVYGTGVESGGTGTDNT